jgi:hypothetical protein
LGGFCYDFVIGDDWRVAIGVVAALLLTYGAAILSIPAWWILPTVVAIVLTWSVWRVAHTREPAKGGR